MALFTPSFPSLLSFPLCECEHLWNLCDEWMRQARRQGNVSHCTTGVSKSKKKENEQGTCVRGCECVCARMWMLGECRSVALELHTKAPTCTLPCIYVLTVRDAECAWTCVCVCACVVRVHRLVSACTWVQGRDRLNLYSWSVPRRDLSSYAGMQHCSHKSSPDPSLSLSLSPTLPRTVKPG